VINFWLLLPTQGATVSNCWPATRNRLHPDENRKITTDRPTLVRKGKVSANRNRAWSRNWNALNRGGRFFHHRSLDTTRLQWFVILFLIELSTRRVEIAGIASSPSGCGLNQIGRNLTDAVDGLLKGKRYLIHDRDPLFTAEFQSLLAERVLPR